MYEERRVIMVLIEDITDMILRKMKSKRSGKQHDWIRDKDPQEIGDNKKINDLEYGEG